MEVDLFECFRITNGDVKDNELSINVNNDFSDALKEKIKNGISKLQSPKSELIPNYKYCYLGWKSLNAIKWFLFDLCKLDESDINELIDHHYVIHELKVTCLTCGVSKIRGSFFLDEIEYHNKINLTDIIDNCNFETPESTVFVTEEEIQGMEERFWDYNEIK